MTPRTWSLLRADARPNRLWLLAVALLLPGLVLAGVGVRSVQQERRAAEQEARDRLDRAAAEGVRRLEDELRQQQAVVAALASSTDDARREALGRMVQPAQRAAPGLAPTPVSASPVLFVAESGGVRVIVRGRLMFAIGPRPVDSREPVRPAALLEAERLEFGDGPRDAVTRAYQQLLTSAPAALQPDILNRLARSLASAGRRSEALRIYARLETHGDAPIGAMPASLIAAYERCALMRGSVPAPPVPPAAPASAFASSPAATACATTFYERLVGGTWPIEKPRFEHYAAEARAWLASDPAAAADLARLRAREQDGRILADEAAAALQAWPRDADEPGARVQTEAGRGWAVVWAGRTATAHVMLLLPSSHMRAVVWPRVFAGPGTDDIAVALISPGGSAVFGALAAATGTPAGGGGTRAGGGDGTPAGNDGASVLRVVRVGDAVWQVQARATRTGRLEGALTARLGILVATLVLMLAALTVGTVLIVRTVRREMQVARLKSQFVSAVSHEFRSPLTSIRQLAELLDRGVPSPERSRQYFKVILEESERLSRLVERILDFSRMEEGRREYARTPLDSAAWLAGVARDAQRLIGTTRLATDIPGDLPALVADGDALALAVHNLIDNAAKYSPGCNTVWLSARARPGAVAIAVRDGGIGIAPTDRPHLFERFFRGAAMAATVKGTGLGLSLVKHIVDAHGGTIAIDSAPGDGTTMTIEVPAEAGTHDSS